MEFNLTNQESGEEINLRVELDWNKFDDAQDTTSS